MQYLGIILTTDGICECAATYQKCPKGKTGRERSCTLFELKQAQRQSLIIVDDAYENDKLVPNHIAFCDDSIIDEVKEERRK